MTPAAGWTCWRDPSHEPVITSRFGWPCCGVCRAAPAYHERWAFALAADITIDLYVPAAGSYAARRVAARSGLVGVTDCDHVDACYEGSLYGQPPGGDAETRWRAAVDHATNRLVVDYPTIARSRFPAETLTHIGLVSVRNGITVNDRAALETWLAT